MRESFGVEERRFIGELGENVTGVLVGVAREVEEGFHLAQCSKPSANRRTISPAPSLDGERPLQTPKHERIENFAEPDDGATPRNQPADSSGRCSGKQSTPFTLKCRVKSSQAWEKKDSLLDSREHLRKQSQVMGGFLDRSCALSRFALRNFHARPKFTTEIKMAGYLRPKAAQTSRLQIHRNASSGEIICNIPGWSVEEPSPHADSASG